MVSDRSPAHSALFGSIRGLYERGLYLDAQAAGAALGGLESWPGVEGLVLAGRLAWRLGASRRATQLHRRAFKLAPENPDAQYYHLTWRRYRRGSWATWRERQRLGPPPQASPPEVVADYHGQCAQLLADLRDFDAAEPHIEQARQVAPSRPYWVVERAGILMQADRHAEALAVAEAGWSASPEYMPIALMLASCLQMLGRHDDAVATLREADSRGQSSEVALLLLYAAIRVRQLDEAAVLADRYEALTPLREATEQNRLTAMRAEVALLRRDHRVALELLDKLPEPFNQSAAANLREVLAGGPALPRRVELAVPFVGQHHKTCAPATLTAISRFWGRSAEQVTIAEEICYDGTPTHSERRWAEKQGWIAREFRVDWPTAVALLERGLPFTLTVSGVTYGHLQAVIGFDEATRVLLARDPNTPDTIQINAAAMIEYERASGPRGMTMVPSDSPHLLDGLTLPEAGLYDDAHAVDSALDANDRPAAVAALDRMRTIAPSHRLTLTARGGLAAYDANPHDSLAATDALLSLYPDEPRLLLSRSVSLRHLAPRAERLTWLGQLTSRREVAPELLLEYASDLAEDGRRSRLALRLLARVMLRWHDAGSALYQLGQLMWRENRQAEATDAHRFAACLEFMREDYARTYFECCRFRRSPDTGLEFLRNRAERLGSRSSLPTLTLVEALDTLGRVDEAFGVLDAAVASRPEDGTLRLFAAERCERYARPDEAAQHRAAAQGRVRQSQWLAAQARDARRRGDRTQALATWQAIIETQPLDLEAQHMTAQLLSETLGRAAAREHLRAAGARFPHHKGLSQLRYQWSDGSSARDREAILREIAAINPADPWVHRELALNLVAQGRLADALDAANVAMALDPGEAASWSIRGWVLWSAGRRAEAANDYRESLDRSVDRGDAIRGMLNCCLSAQERIAALAFVAQRVAAESVSGDGVSAWHLAARGVLTPPEVLAELRNMHSARSDLLVVWAALVEHVTDLGMTDEALRLAREATERFPMAARVWQALGRTHAALRQRDECADAMRRALELDPDDPASVGRLAEALDNSGRVSEAIALVEAHVSRNPTSATLRAELACRFWARGDRDRAIAAIRQALELDPDYSVAWTRLGSWASAMGNNDEVLVAARDLATTRPGEAAPWVRLGLLELQAGRATDALSSAERALAANPHLDEAWDLKAEALTLLRRYAEAEAACAPSVYGAAVPHSLQGRAAWVDAQRGDRTAALTRMRAILAAYPDYAWGWRQLMDWSAQGEGREEALLAADRLTWLLPWSAEGHSLAGWLHARAGASDRALLSYERALQVEPANVSAGFALFDIQLGRGDLDGSRRTLAIISPYATPDSVTSAEISLAALAGSRDTCIALLRQLLAQDGAPADTVWPAVESVAGAGYGEAMDPVLWNLMTGGACHPLTPAVWARLRARRERWVGAFGYRRLAGLGALAAPAVYEMLDQIGSAASEASRRRSSAWRASWELFWIRRFFRTWRATDDFYWGKVGFAWLSLGRTAAVRRWLRDWQGRKAVESWMLQNLVVAHLSEREDRDALFVLRHVASEVMFREATNPILRLWCAIGAALDGDPDRSERVLRDVPVDAVATADRPLREAAESLAAALREPRGAQAWPAARRELLTAVRSATFGDSASGRLVRLMSLKGARHGAVPWLVVAAWCDLHARRLTTAAVIAGLVAVRALVG